MADVKPMHLRNIQKKVCLKFVEEKEQKEIKIGRNRNGKYKTL
jgi:hypothetical protein